MYYSNAFILVKSPEYHVTIIHKILITQINITTYIKLHGLAKCDSHKLDVIKYFINKCCLSQYNSHLISTHDSKIQSSKYSTVQESSSVMSASHTFSVLFSDGSFSFCNKLCLSSKISSV